MKSILVLTCLCVIVVSSVKGTSLKVLDFIHYFNGDFDNKAQTDKPGDDHEFVLARIKPVDIKCLRPNPVIFGEEGVGDNIRNMYLAVVTDNGMEDTVILTVYQLPDYKKYKLRELIPENLFNISCEELLGDPDCIASYRVASGFVYGNFPQCLYTVNGTHPRYITRHTCHNFTSKMPMYEQQKPPTEPYEFLAFQKYPLINPPPGYVSPCDN